MVKRVGYPSNKDSGVDWLGDVPSHWVVARMRFYASPNPSKQEVAHLPPDTEVSFLPMEAVGEDGSLRIDQFRLLGDVTTGYTYFAEGDVSFAKITPCFENGKGALMSGLPGGFGFGTTELTVLRPKTSCNSRFLWWMTQTHPFRRLGEASMYGAGGQKRVPDAFAEDFRSAWPPFTEQNAIVSFLDRETKNIESLINEQHNFIELLLEKRLALISQVVTKGLDPSTPMINSGIEWLGRVPEHWDIIPCRGFVLERSGKNDGAECTDYLSLMANVGIIPYEEKGDIGNKKPEDLSKCKIVNKGDFVINSMNYGIGSYGVSNYDGVCSPVYIVLRPIEEVVEPGFAFRIFENRAFQLFAQSFGNGILAHRCAINWDILKNIGVGIPPIEEQRAIIQYLDRETAKFDSLIAEAETSITLLQEHRSALITAVVTGKVDVREAVSA